MSAEKHMIQFKLNGRDVSADVAPHWNMVELLQGEFGLTGARESCGRTDEAKSKSCELSRSLRRPLFASTDSA